MAASCGADAAVNVFQDPQCQRYATTITQPNNVCTKNNTAPGSASMKFMCSTQNKNATNVATSAAPTNITARKASKIDPLFVTLFLNSFFGEYFVNDTSSMELFFTFVFTKVAGGGNKFLKNNGKVQSTSRRPDGTKAKFELA
jgi:hypothetical protein